MSDRTSAARDRARRSARAGHAALAAALALACLGAATAGAAPGRAGAPRATASAALLRDGFAGGRLDPARWTQVWGETRVAGGAALLRSARPLTAAETHSSLVTSRRSFADFVLRLELGAVAQLRAASPNPWETAWVVFRYRGPHDYYYFLLKPNGWELGKKQGSDAQVFLATGGSPRLPVGARARVRIAAAGPVVAVAVDGVPVVRYRDSAPLPGGAVGLYEEDAVARFADVRVTPLPRPAPRRTA
ncbi:MAG TPA: family 16 glycoside hydrolase [Gaiellaceae bacterium]|nr:family 16 glycoside hydrolase [Gaiellaceae bacterium]